MSQDITKFFIVTYTNWTHTYFIQTLTSEDVQFDQRTLNNEEVYSKFYVRSTVEFFNKLKKLNQSNTDLSFNIEYGDY
jgi:hypothetical protein